LTARATTLNETVHREFATTIAEFVHEVASDASVAGSARAAAARITVREGTNLSLERLRRSQRLGCGGGPARGSGQEDRERGEALVLELLEAHADSLLRVARRYSMWSEVRLHTTAGRPSFRYRG
jgi:hypothetical protein